MDGRLQHNNNKRRASESSDAFHNSTTRKRGRWVFVEGEVTSQLDNGLLQLQDSTHHMHNFNNHLSHQYQPPPPSYFPPLLTLTANQMDKERKMKQRIDMMEMELNKLKSSHNSINSNTRCRPPPPIISKPPPPPRPIAKRVSEVLTPSLKTKPRIMVPATFTKNGYHPRIMEPAMPPTKNNRTHSKTPPPPLVHQVSISKSTSYEDEMKMNNMQKNTTNRYTSNETPLMVHMNTTKLVERKRDVFEERLRSESSSMADKKKAYSSRGLWYRTGVQDAVKGVRMQEAISTTTEVGKGKGDVGKGRIVHQDIIHTEGYKKRQDEVTMLLQMTNGYTFCGHEGCKNKASVGGLCCREDCVALKHEASRKLQEAIQNKGTCDEPTDVINTMPADPIVLPSLGGFTPEEYEIRVKWKRMRDVQQRKVPWRKKYTYQQKENPSTTFYVDPVHRHETLLQRWERVAAKYDIANMNVDSPPKHFKRVESHSELFAPFLKRKR